MDFEDPLVEVAQRLSGNGAVTIRLELTATPARRMITKHGSGPRGRSRGLEIDLDDLPGGVTAHHHMEETDSSGQRNLEQRSRR
jgi:hypothetical protein